AADFGHTSLVIDSHQVNGAGTGPITVLEQNVPEDPIGRTTLTMSDWKLPSNVKNWLHHTVDLFPQTAPFKTNLRISGAGFSANEQVKITFDDTIRVGMTAADRTGAFSTTITVPSSLLPGTHTVVERQ